MESAERQRLRQLIKDKKAEWLAKHAPREITPERQTEIDTILNNIRKEIVTIQTGPNDYRITTREALAEEALARGLTTFQVKRGVIFCGALTKSLLMVLPAESYMISGIFKSDGNPQFSGIVGGGEVRQQLWVRLRSLQLSGRNFEVFQDEQTGLLELSRRQESHRLWIARREGVA